MQKNLFLPGVAFAALLTISLPSFAQNAVNREVAITAPVVTGTPVTTGAVAANPGPLLGQEGLNSTLWVQTSAEARFASLQAYALARRELDLALRDRNWSAATEQVFPFKKKKPAIILDIDETVLDNSAYQARLVRDDKPYSGVSWESWVSQSAAPAMPGAVKFLTYAASKGVQIFYVSNRGTAEEAATRANLLNVGLPVQGPEDHILMNGETPDWTSDKTSRRSFLTQKYRVVLLFGDDFNDFVTAKPLSVQQRFDLLAKFEPYIGERWILLSNPLYGSWEGAILNYQNGLTTQEIFRLKYGQLRTQEPVSAPIVPAPDAAGATR